MEDNVYDRMFYMTEVTDTDTVSVMQQALREGDDGSNTPENTYVTASEENIMPSMERSRIIGRRIEGLCLNYGNQGDKTLQVSATTGSGEELTAVYGSNFARILVNENGTAVELVNIEKASGEISDKEMFDTMNSKINDMYSAIRKENRPINRAQGALLDSVGAQRW